MSKNKEITKSEFYCTECGKKGIPLPRKVGQEREAGHLKKLYCLYCKKVVNHAEVRPFGAYNVEDFRKEFDLGRFINGERVPLNQLFACKNIKCKYNQNGKCWNANHSYKCKKRGDDLND